MARNTAKNGKSAGEYEADKALRKPDQQHHIKNKAVKFSSLIKEQAVNFLYLEKWSPEIICVDGHKTGKYPMSIESLQQLIW